MTTEFNLGSKLKFFWVQLYISATADFKQIGESLFQVAQASAAGHYIIYVLEEIGVLPD